MAIYLTSIYEESGDAGVVHVHVHRERQAVGHGRVVRTLQVGGLDDLPLDVIGQAIGAHEPGRLADFI